MGLLDKLKAIFGGAGAGSRTGGDSHSYYYFVRCRRCHEILKARADLRNELSAEYDDSGQMAYVYRKVLIGSKRCFEPIEVTMTFDARRNVTSQHVTGGEFVTEEDYVAANAVES